jgi:hypothetical protein
VPPLLALDDLVKSAGEKPRWLWHGYLAPGTVTLLTSQWKSGKTTLVSVLLARMKEGGRLAGLPVARGRAVVVTEEGPEHWVRRAARLDLGGHVFWVCRPFRGKPTPQEWQHLLAGLAAERARRRLDLVVIDPLASFLPGRDESNAGLMLEALLPLQQLTACGLAVLVLHHPRKGEPAPGQAARGSGALSGYVDVLVEMCCFAPGADADRRRRLRAWSRYDETPRQHAIELTADGTDYVALGDFQEAEFAGSWAVVKSILASATGKLTRQDVRSAWPPAEAAPDEATVARWLERGVAEGLLRRDGRGYKRNPFRYWLPEKEEEWRRDELTLPDLPEVPGLAQRVLFNAAKIVLDRRAEFQVADSPPPDGAD